MTQSRENMQFGVPYFTGNCTNCRQPVVSGSGLELIYAQWPDGAVDEHNACAKCVVHIKAHNEKTEKELQKQRQPEVQVYPPEVESVRERMQPPAVAPARPAAPSLTSDVELKGILQGIGAALTGLAEGQQALIAKLSPPEPKAKAKKPAAKSNAKPSRRK